MSLLRNVIGRTLSVQLAMRLGHRTREVTEMFQQASTIVIHFRGSRHAEERELGTVDQMRRVTLGKSSQTLMPQ